ncbi:MAG: hypothetical protein OHK0024_32490 [Thalassobaculales bacterium]
MVIEDGWWWVPFLALFAGLRAEEALQLRSDDITEARGVPVIRVAWHEDARRKTASARHMVPIHAELIRLGLLDFAAAARAKGSRLLFPEMPRGKARNSLSAYYSRRFTDLRCSLGLPDACDFHAFRTTFITTVEGLPTTSTTLVDSTVGHKPRRETAAHYAKLGPQQARAGRFRGFRHRPLAPPRQPAEAHPALPGPPLPPGRAGGRGGGVKAKQPSHRSGLGSRLN